MTPRRRRWPWILASLGGLLIVLAGCVLVLLATAADHAFVVRKVLAAANQSFAGRIELERAWLFPNGHFVARDVAIYGPDGDLIVRAATVDTHVDLLALAANRLHLTRTVLGHATLFLSTDADDNLNIVRAFGPKHPAPPALPRLSAAKAASGFAVEIEDAEVELDEARFDRGTPASPVSRVAELRHVELVSRFTLDARGAIAIGAKVKRGDAVAPLEGALALSATVGINGQALEVATDATFNDAHALAQMSLMLDPLKGQGALTDVQLGPRFLASVLPPFDARGVRGRARVELDEGVVRLVSLDAEPLDGVGRLTGSGRLDLRKGSGDARVRAEELDLHAWSGKLPASKVEMELAVTAAQLLTQPPRLTAHLEVRASTVGGQRLGPGALDAELVGETLAVSQLDFALPGASLRGSGKLARQHIAATARVDVHDLQALREAAEALGAPPLPHFAGRMSGGIEIAGAPSALGLRADLVAPRLVLQGAEADGVEAHLQAPRFGRTMEVHGTATIGGLRVLNRTLRDLAISLAWTTPNLHLEAQAREPDSPIQLVADAMLPADLEHATLSTLELRVPGDTWSLTRPTAVDFRRGLSFADLELSSGPQRVVTALDVNSSGLEGSFVLAAVDLARLPGVGSLSGKLDGKASYRESHGRRDASADLQVSRLAYVGLEVPSAHLGVSLDGEHATANISAKLPHGDLTLSAEGPLPSQLGRVQAHFQVAGLAIDDVARFEPRLAPYHGSISADLRLDGSWSSPEVLLAASASQLTGPWSANPVAGVMGGPLTLALDAKLDANALSQSLNLQAGQTPLLTLSGTAPLPAQRLLAALRAPSTLRPLFLALPFQERLTLANAPLGLLGQMIPGTPRIEGTAAAQGRIVGPVRSPQGELTLEGEKLVYEGRSVGALTLRLSANDRGFTAHAEVHPAQGQLSAEATWSLPPRELANPEERRAAPLSADVRGTGIPLSALLEPQSALQGTGDFSGSLRGSWGTPQARANLRLGALSVRGVAAGELAAEARWNGVRLEATVRGDQPRGGQLEGHATVPLTPSGLVANQPLAAALDAKGFDLAPFSTLATQSGTLRAIGGLLDAHLRVGGTAGTPRPSGSLALSNGRLALAGLGHFSALEAQLSLDGSGLEIRKVSGKSAAGTFLMTGALRAGQGKGLAVQVHIDTRRFGVYASDRLLGQLSSNEDVSGTVSAQGTDLTLLIHSAELQLASLLPKTSRPTSLDPDIVIGNKKPLATRRADAYPFRLHVVAPDSLRLEATDLHVKARADVTLAVQGDAEMRGGIFATNGELNAYGRRFEIDHANATFGHGQDFGPANNPDIDARAVQTVGKYHLFIDVTGHPASLKVATRSEPPLDKEHVGLLLVSGTDDSASPSGGLAAASALGGLLSEKLKESLGAYLPLDTVTVEPSHLEAGKRLTPELYVGAIENLGALDPRVNGAEIHANYKLSPRWSIDSRYGTARAGNLDLQWTKDW